MLERDGYECQNCGRDTSDLEVHHIVPLEKGGSNNIRNLATLCQDCHSSIHSSSKTAPTPQSNSSSRARSTRINSSASRTRSTQTNNSSSADHASSQNQGETCPECEHSSHSCYYDRYDDRAVFCDKCRTLWKYEEDSWDVVACPECNSQDGFTWGEIGGRLGSCNNCGSDFYPARN